MKSMLTMAIAVSALCVQSAAQDQPTRLMPVTSLPIPVDLVPPEEEPIKCGFPIILHALHEARRGLTPDASGDTRGLTQLERSLARPELQTSTLTGSFRVHYDTVGNNTPALLDPVGNRIPGTARACVDSIISILSHVVPVETGTLHYPAPISDGTLGGGPEYDIYVMELGAMYGFTTPDVSTAPGGRAASWITIDNDFVFVRPEPNRGLPGFKVTIAHELHHAIQIGNYGYWDEDPFFYEITSTWMEDVVYTEVNDYYNYLKAVWSHFRSPETPFTSGEMIMYSRAIWGHYISERFGIDVMREIWEKIRLLRPQLAIDQTLREHGVDLAGAYAEWSIWNYFTGSRAKPGLFYADAADYPEIIQSPVDFAGPSRDVPGSLGSMGTHYVQVVRSPDTMTVMMCNVDLAGTILATIPVLPYTLRLRSTRLDESYKSTPIGIFTKLDAADMSLWRTYYLGDTVRPYIDPTSFSSERPFPIPFHPGPTPYVYIPVDGVDRLVGSLYVFSASADLVASMTGISSTAHLGRQMFTWNGRTNDGTFASTGVYLFVIELPGGRVTGKIPVVRE